MNRIPESSSLSAASQTELQSRTDMSVCRMPPGVGFETKSDLFALMKMLSD
jgi:hypothetical protein